jgi:hypothetical protein
MYSKATPADSAQSTDENMSPSAWTPPESVLHRDENGEHAAHAFAPPASNSAPIRASGPHQPPPTANATLLPTPDTGPAVGVIVRTPIST